MIKFDKIGVTFNKGTVLETQALRGLSLDISEGEFVCVIGSNGAGKSTLLNTLCGDIIPDQGKIWVDSQDVTSWDTWQRAKWVARVFQDPMAGTCANLSIEENLALALGRGQKRGLRPALDKAKRELFKHQLARLGLGLEARLSDPIGLLSGGQRQAISLLMATLTPMKILALDEHTAALDPKTAAFVLSLSETIIAENKLTALMVTHSMHQALQVGTRTIMMHEGKVIFDVKGKARQGLTVQDLLNLFETQQGSALTNDDLLLDA